MILRNLNELPALLRPGQCLLGLDYGSKNIGLAVSDPNRRVASPLTTIIRKKFTEDAAAIMALIHERNIGGLVIGMPKNLEGEDGAMAQAARAFVRNLSRLKNGPTADMPAVFWDERFSTAAMQRFMIGEDISRKRRAEIVDKAAAAYILQGALDAMNRTILVQLP